MEKGVQKQKSKLAPRVRLVCVEQASAVGEPVQIYGPSEAADIARNVLKHKDREHFIVLHLDGAGRASSIEVVAIGSLTEAQVHPREVFKAAILANARSIICAHNHPSGVLTPSKADRRVYEVLKEAGDLLGIRLLDFLIVSDTNSWAASEHWG